MVGQVKVEVMQGLAEIMRNLSNILDFVNKRIKEHFDTDKKPHIFPEIPKNKWLRMYQKRMKKQRKKQKNQQNIQEIRQEIYQQILSWRQNKNKQSVSIKEKFVYCDRQKEPLDHANKLQSACGIWGSSQTQLNRNTDMRSLIAKCSPLSTSFALPYFLKINERQLIEVNIIKKLYQLIQNYRRQIDSDNEKQEHLKPFNVLGHAITFTADKSFPFAFRNEKQVQELQSVLKENIGKSKGVKIVDNLIIRSVIKRDNEQIQSYLKQLRQAKIYRYMFNAKISSLVQNYTFLKKNIGFYPVFKKQEIEQIEGFQYSDIGLFDKEKWIGQEQQSQIVKYWQQIYIKAYEIDPKPYLEQLNNKIDHKIKISQKMIVRQDISVAEYYQFLKAFKAVFVDQDFLSNHLTYYQQKQAYDKIIQKFQNRYDKMKISSKTKLAKPAPIRYGYNGSNAIRIFAKWSLTDECDGLQASAMFTKMMLKQIDIHEVINQLKLDYIQQIIIPRETDLAKIKQNTQQYQRLIVKLDQTQMEEFRDNQDRQYFFTPVKGISRFEPTAPKKQKPSNCKKSDEDQFESVQSPQISLDSFELMQPKNKPISILSMLKAYSSASPEYEQNGQSYDEIQSAQDVDVDFTPNNEQEEESEQESLESSQTRQRAQANNNVINLQEEDFVEIE